MSQKQNRKPKSEIICRCNSISREVLENAIKNGCKTMNEIYDQTTAGVGPCGGSCRRKIRPLLEAYLQNGVFPEKIIEDLTGKAPKGGNTQDPIELLSEGEI